RRVAPQLADVLDVVVDEHRVVHQLDRRGGVEGLFDAGAERLGAGNQQTGPQHAAGALGVRGHEIVEVRTRLLVGQVLVQVFARARAVLGDLLLDQARRRLDGERRHYRPRRRLRVLPRAFVLGRGFGVEGARRAVVGWLEVCEEAAVAAAGREVGSVARFSGATTRTRSVAMSSWKFLA